MDTPVQPYEQVAGGLDEPFPSYLNDVDTSGFLNDLSDVDLGETFPSRPLQYHDASISPTGAIGASPEPIHSRSSPREAHASSQLHQPKATRGYGTVFLDEELRPHDAFEPGPLLQQTGPIESLPWLADKEPILPNTNKKPPPKIGKRFSSESVRVLKAWLSNNIRRPYPSPNDVEALQRQTGLNRQQITTWLANARRRLKSQPERPPTPLVRSSLPPPLSVPSRRKTPATAASFEDMDPLERWQHSPPEHEPATVSAIAQAVRGFSSATYSPDRLYSGDSDPGRSIQSSSSAGSTVASQSSSAYSHTSGSSLRSLDKIRKAIRRKRRRVPTERPAVSETCYPYQCTFCTETFKTKWSWKRHEKSLHLSLERWECTPSGPTILNGKSENVCIYCGLVSPDLKHLQSHNFTACHERALEERTFYRKDHLQQHLKLVHNAQFMKWPMDAWKHESERIRSRCGFCGMQMEFWSDRVDHLAEHFKAGQSMMQWKGDWGFDSDMLDMVENSMPPYLIHYERYSPWPFTTQQGEPGSPANAFELIKFELEYFYANYTNARQHPPSDQELLYESCCIIFGAEILSEDPTIPGPSWLRDLLLSSEEVAKQARMRPMKSAAKSRITKLKINGKDDIFQACPMEERLQQYTEIPKLIGLGVEDDELQREASASVEAIEELSQNPSSMFVNFLTGLIFGSTAWLAPFRQRAGLETSSTSILDIKPPVSADTVFDTDLQPFDTPEETLIGESPPGAFTGADIVSTKLNSGMEGPASFHFLNDSNCYRRLGRQLTRFVMSTMSPHNPNSHVPTDEELQHQARWIMFDDGDPWNQTPADNPVWLQQFKKDVGLLPTESPSQVLDE
ncbi:homeobox and C2H2 transcription factor [Fusarium albosuccineum]|uniref:Homeobox and C2H2 transcription factor n=1 Tax=Fusarium albosuccineum TaxID=1237068 RepID=A0A8H4LQ47_9HYPO|nr:homeobox and C2H2 transcription factor [Fusarium albosuccineum]